MRLYLYILFLLSLMAISAIGQWYAGGNLHDKTVENWKHSSQDNQLATAADFIAKLQPSLISKEKDFKIKSKQLMICINEAVKNDNFDHLEITKLAVVCFFLLNEN